MAKKSKPAKKAAPKKTVKKAVAKSASPKRKKAGVKKAMPGKPAAKKAAVRKALAKPAARKGAKKASPKKVAVKKAAAKKVIAKKAVVKKAVSKKVIVKKAAAKKPAVKKAAAAKLAVKPVLPVVKKKPVLVKKIKPAPIPAAVPLPPVEERSEELAVKAANIDADSIQVILPGKGLHEGLPSTDDTIKTFDRNLFSKATTTGVPHSNLQYSSKPKNAVKPSGKKPLWRK